VVHIRVHLVYIVSVRTYLAAQTVTHEVEVVVLPSRSQLGPPRLWNAWFVAVHLLLQREVHSAALHWITGDASRLEDGDVGSDRCRKNKNIVP
jgi:hypothetical protein